MEEKKNNLETLRILFLIKGILTILMGFIFVAYAIFGMFFTSIIEESQRPQDPDFPFINPGIIFAIAGVIGALFCFAVGIFTILASKYLKERRNPKLIFAAAITNCFTGILGILMGVFAIVELQKPEIKELFEEKKESSTSW